MSAEAKNRDSRDDEFDLTNKLVDQTKHLQLLRKQIVQMKRQLKSQKSMRDESQLRRDQRVSIEQEEHWRELERLNDLLTAERQKFDGERTARIQLQAELEISQSQLDKVKHHMKKEEELSVVLSRLQEQSEILHSSTDHQMVEMEKKEEKLIQEVWEAQHMVTRLAEELQVEKNLNLVLRQQMEGLTLSHVELSRECEAAVHQSDVLKQKLEVVINSQAEKVEKDQLLIQQLQEELGRALEVRADSAHQVKCKHERVEENLGHGQEHHTDAVQRSDASKQKLEMVTKSHEKTAKDHEQIIVKLRTEQEELKERIKELTTSSEVLEEHGDQEDESDTDLETSRDGRHSSTQHQQELTSEAEDALDDSCPVLPRKGSDGKQLLPPVHRSMRKIRRFLGLRPMRQKTPTY